MQFKLSINGHEKLTLPSFTRDNLDDLRDLIIILRRLIGSTNGGMRSDLFQLVKSMIFTHDDDRVTAKLLNQPSGSHAVFKWNQHDPLIKKPNATG
tara:strand:- start:1002 stop:1289 length:288 start_codon:yes stop_codon:yes gene_type:complete